MLNSLKVNLIRKKWLTSLAAVVVALGGVGLSHAATDSTTTPPPGNAMFLQIAGVGGESTDSQHPGTIEVNSFNWGTTATPGVTASGSSGGGTGKVSFNDLTITKKIDKSSPVLMQSVAGGKHFDEVKLICRKAGGGQQDFLVITMSDATVSSFQTSGDSANFNENVTFNFSKVEFKETPQNSDGSASNPVLGTSGQLK